MEMALAVDIITHLLKNTLNDPETIQQYVNEENITELIGVIKDLLDDEYSHYNNTLLALQSNDLDHIKINIDNAKSLYYEGLDNPDITRDRLDRAHHELRNALNSLRRSVEKSADQLRQCESRFNKNSIFGQRNLNAEIDKNIAQITRAMHLFGYTVELDYAVNAVLGYNVDRSFNDPCREMIKYIEDKKIHRLVLSLCDNDEIYDFWYHMDNNLRVYLEPPIKYKEIGVKEDE